MFRYPPYLANKFSHLKYLHLFTFNKIHLFFPNYDSVELH